SSKPGVESSILTGACALQFYGNHHLNNCASFQTLLVGGKRCLLWHHINSGTPDFRSQKLQLCGFIAQWLEHLSSKPGVMSSILTGACALRCSFTATITRTTVPDFNPLSRLVGGKRWLLSHHINSATRDFGSQKLQLCGFIAQWLEHWSSKPGVVRSILTGACALQFYGNHQDRKST